MGGLIGRPKSGLIVVGSKQTVRESDWGRYEFANVTLFLRTMDGAVRFRGLHKLLRGKSALGVDAPTTSRNQISW